MAFISTNLQTNLLYHPETAPTTAAAWATQFAVNINNYFMTGMAKTITIGTFLYTHIPPLVTIPATLIADMIDLYNTNTTVEAAQWGEKLASLITDWWGKVLFTGTKQLITYPFTTTPWAGTVSTDLAEPVLIAALTPLYIPESAPPDATAFASAIEQAIDGAAKLCYLELPVILLG